MDTVPRWETIQKHLQFKNEPCLCLLCFADALRDISRTEQILSPPPKLMPER